MIHMTRDLVLTTSVCSALDAILILYLFLIEGLTTPGQKKTFGRYINLRRILSMTTARYDDEIEASLLIALDKNRTDRLGQLCNLTVMQV